MADPTIQPRVGTQPLPAYKPPAAPAGNGGAPPPADGATPGATAPRDAARLGGKPGTSRLSLSTAAQALGDLGTAAGRLGQVLDTDAVQGTNDMIQGATDLASGIGDTANGTIESVNKFQRGLGTRVANAAEKVNDVIGEGSKAGRALMGAGGVLGVVGGGAQVFNGIQQLNEGKAAEGGFTVAGGGARVLEGAGLTFAAVRTGTAAAEFVGGRAVPVLGAAAGVFQVGAALSKDPADVKSAITGTMTAVGSAAMLFPPVGTAIGGAAVATAAIIDNWDTITAGASKVASWLGF